MVRFDKKELHMLMGALEAFWGSYENWEQEGDEETKNEYKKYNDEAVRIYKKISWELEQREIRKDAKMEKQLLKMAKDLQEKQKNNK